MLCIYFIYLLLFNFVYFQAHARARFVLMRLLELEGNGILTVTEVDPGKNLLLTLDRKRLATDGKRIVGKNDLLLI